jgi:hypothetical protein
MVCSLVSTAVIQPRAYRASTSAKHAVKSLMPTTGSVLHRGPASSRSNGYRSRLANAAKASGGYDKGRARMRVFTYQPAPPLSEYVELFWVIEGQRPDRGLERVLPTGDMQRMVGPPDGRFLAYDQATGAERRYDDALFCAVPPRSPWSSIRLRRRGSGAGPAAGLALSLRHAGRSLRVHERQAKNAK